MAWWRRFLLRLADVCRSARTQSHLEREIRSHLGLLEDEYRAQRLIR